MAGITTLTAVLKFERSYFPHNGNVIPNTLADTGNPPIRCLLLPLHLQFCFSPILLLPNSAPPLATRSP